MKVTYIKHSGFLVEWADVACLFDWAEGELPAIEAGKKLFVFASHAHADHYDPAIFRRLKDRRDVTYILSDDIRPPEGASGVIRLGPDRRRMLPAGVGILSVTTLGSTDQGVAFVVHYADKTVYHAGDLHWWAWPDDTAREEKEMKSAFFTQLMKLKDLRVDAAFIPLDPRLGGNFWMGFDAVMRTARVAHAFPMHLWEKYETVDKLRQLPVSAPWRDTVAEIKAPGQTFEI